MDVSAILVLPFSAIVAFVTLIVAAMVGRPVPRLIWPCAFSVVAATLLLLRFPEPATLVMWLFALFALAFSAAIGTVIGGVAARRIAAAIRARRHG